MNKRGLSEIVIGIMIILISVSAVVLVYNYINDPLREELGGNLAESTLFGEVLEIKSVNYVQGGGPFDVVDIVVEKKSGKENVEGILIYIIGISGESCVIEKRDEIINKFEVKKIENIENCLEPKEEIAKINIVPLFKKNGREIVAPSSSSFDLINSGSVGSGGNPNDPWDAKIIEFQNLYAEARNRGYGVYSYDFDENLEYDVEIRPGDNVLSKVSGAGIGETILFREGIYRLDFPISPKRDQKFYAEPGTILSGAVLIKKDEIIEENNYYVIENLIHDVDSELLGDLYTDYDGNILAVCSDDANDRGCINPQDLYIDDVMLYEVPSLSEVSQGKYYVDYNLKKIYFVDSPYDLFGVIKKIEVSKTPHAFFGSVGGVTIRGFIIEKFASQFQYSAIQGTNVEKDCGENVRPTGNNRNRIPYYESCANYGGINRTQKTSSDDWSIENNDVRWNHAIGITLGHNAYMKGNKIHHNGQKGLASSGDNLQIIENEVYKNPWVEDEKNVAGFTDTGNFTSMGGMKLNDVQVARLSNNYFHDNNHVGMWTDGYNTDIIYEYNVVVNNSAIGISHEISHDAIIRNNYVVGNGKADTFLGDSGIMIHNSDNVEIYNNYVSGNGNGIGVKMQNRGNKNTKFDELGDDCMKYGKLLHTLNITIYDNYIDIGRDSRQRTGMVASKNFECSGFKPWNEYLNPDNVKFTNNKYIYSSPNNDPFSWGDSKGISYSAWTALGQS